MAERWWRVASPLALAECEHGGVEVSESADDQEYGSVGGRIVNSGRHVGDEKRRITLCTSMYVNLIISGSCYQSAFAANVRHPALHRKRDGNSLIKEAGRPTIVGQELHRLRKDFQELLIEHACHCEAAECSVACNHTVKLAGFALLNELSPVASFRLNELSNVGQRVPGVFGTVFASEFPIISLPIGKVTYMAISPSRRTLGFVIAADGDVSSTSC